MQQPTERTETIATVAYIDDQLDLQPTSVTIVRVDRALKNHAQPKLMIEAPLPFWQRLTGFVSLLAILPVL